MKHIIETYLQLIESGDAERMSNLFSADGIVHSPLYGDMPAAGFFGELFADTTRSKIFLLNLFNNPDKPLVYAAHFSYHWVLKNNIVTSFECVDVFEFNEYGKIKEMTIIYDTYKTRKELETLD